MKIRMPASQAAHSRVCARMPLDRDSARGLVVSDLRDLLHFCRVERLPIFALLREARELFFMDVSEEEKP